MPRKPVSGFAEAGAAMAQQLDDNDLLNLFSAVGRVVAKRFLLKRPCLDRWQLVVDYLTSAMAFAPREQFRVLYLDKRNNLIADECEPPMIPPCASHDDSASVARLKTMRASRLGSPPLCRVLVWSEQPCCASMVQRIKRDVYGAEHSAVGQSL
jgi:hypothetical protein